MDERANKLREMKICRFCLTEKEPLSNIYQRINKNSIPLPVQIMACVALEIFSNDGMPQLICDNCRIQTNRSYLFKTTCKQSDDALKHYLATGVLQKDLEKEISEDPEKLPQCETPETENQPSRKRLKLEKDSVEEDEEEYREELIDQEIYMEELSEKEKDKKKVSQVATYVFPCNKCERSFPLQQLLDIHMRQHTRERRFQCNECDKKFFNKHDLAKHEEIHSGQKPYSCVVCQKTFSRATLLHRHEKVHVSVPKYLCTYCDRTYLASVDLDVHMQIHKKRRPFKCNKCDKSFAFKQGLERHEVIHNNDNPHKCNYCSESFTTPSKLARHVTSHAGTRPYPCKLCSRTFLLSHHLSRHLKNHYVRQPVSQQDRQFKCDVCSMSFSNSSELVAHSAIHSMVNLRCVICDREFDDAIAVKKHVPSHLSGLCYPCDRCDYSFEKQEELEYHEIQHTDLETDEPKTSLENKEQEKEVDNEQEYGVGNLRRSMRPKKLKNFPDFLKDDLDTDSDSEEEPQEEDLKLKITGSIQPIIRNEAVKTYKGVKDKVVSKPPVVITDFNPPSENNQKSPTTSTTTTSTTTTKITTLETLGLAKGTLDAITEKSGVVEMKVGQKVIRVQKLMMNKSDVQAMVQEGKIELKGSTVVLKTADLKELTQLSKPKDTTISPETRIEMGPELDPPIKISMPLRTYVKKTSTPIKKEEFEPIKYIAPVESGINIDLVDDGNDQTTAVEEILGCF